MYIGEKVTLLRDIFGEGNNLKFAEIMGETPATTSNWCKAKSLGREVLVKILSKLPEVDANWLLMDNGSMLKSDSLSMSTPANINNSVSYKLVPLLNLDAVGGVHSPNSIAENTEYTEKLIPFTDAKEGDVALVVSGNSMDPTCPAGSKVLLREVKNWREYFGFGNIFVVLLTDGRRILKEVQKYPEDSKNYVLCKSHNDKYPEEELPKSMIEGVWKVVKILNERGW